MGDVWDVSRPTRDPAKPHAPRSLRVEGLHRRNLGLRERRTPFLSPCLALR